MNSKSRELENRIQNVKQQLIELGELHPGTLSKQYNVCGNPACRCKATPPQKHGPYYQLSWTRNRRSTSRFIQEQDVRTTRERLANYKRLRALIDQWIDASVELSQLKLNQSRAKSKAAKRS